MDSSTPLMLSQDRSSPQVSYKRLTTRRFRRPLKLDSPWVLCCRSPRAQFSSRLSWLGYLAVGH